MKPFSIRSLSQVIVLAVFAFLLIPAAPAGAVTYTLDQCIDKALGTDVAMVRAQADLMRRNADLLSARGSFLPSVDWSMSRTFNHTVSPLGVVFNEFSGQYDSIPPLYEKAGFYRAELSASWTLMDGFFGRFWNYKRQRAFSQSSNHAITEQELQTAYNVSQYYFSLLEASALLDIRRKNVERNEQLMEIASTKYELGSNSLSDVLKAKVTLSQSQLDLLTAENGLELAKADLNRAIGEPVEQDLQVEDIEFTPTTITFENARDRALENNPGYLSAQANVKAAKNGLWYSRRSYFPRIDIGIGRSYSNPKLKLDDMLDTKFTNYFFWSLRFNIINNNQSFSTKVGTEYAKAELNTARYTELDKKREVELEIRKSYLAVQEKIKAQELAGEKLESAEEDYKLAQEKYTLGAGTILDILEAEYNLKTAEVDKIEKKYDYFLAVSALKKAMGSIE